MPKGFPTPFIVFTDNYFNEKISKISYDILFLFKVCYS